MHSSTVVLQRVGFQVQVVELDGQLLSVGRLQTQLRNHASFLHVAAVHTVFRSGRDIDSSADIDRLSGCVGLIDRLSGHSAARRGSVSRPDSSLRTALKQAFGAEQAGTVVVGIVLVAVGVTRLVAAHGDVAGGRTGPVSRCGDGDDHLRVGRRGQDVAHGQRLVVWESADGTESQVRRTVRPIGIAGHCGNDHVGLQSAGAARRSAGSRHRSTDRGARLRPGQRAHLHKQARLLTDTFWFRKLNKKQALTGWCSRYILC